MWIRSQDKKLLTDGQTNISAKCYCGYWFVQCNDRNIAEYRSEKEVINCLDKIQKCLEVNNDVITIK